MTGEVSFDFPSDFNVYFGLFFFRLLWKWNCLVNNEFVNGPGKAGPQLDISLFRMYMSCLLDSWTGQSPNFILNQDLIVNFKHNHYLAHQCLTSIAPKAHLAGLSDLAYLQTIGPSSKKWKLCLTF